MRLLVSLATLFAVLTAAVLAAFLAAVIYSAALPGGKLRLGKRVSVKSLLPSSFFLGLKLALNFSSTTIYTSLKSRKFDLSIGGLILISLLTF